MAGSQARRWTRRSAHEWRALLARFGDSGLSVEAFCRREAISAASFYRWRGSLGSGADGARTVEHTPPAFVDLGPLMAAPASEGRLELRLELGAGLTLTLVRD